MNLGRNKIVFLGIFFFSAVFGNLQNARAEELVGIKMQPSIIEERADLGQTYSWTLRATNVGAKTQEFYVVKRDISGLSEEGRPTFANTGEKTGLELAAWIEIASGPITIAPGETKDMPFSITVPRNASPGAHLGSIFLSSEPVRPETTGIGIGYQVATIISLRVAGDIAEEAMLREFRTDKIIYGKPEVNFITKIENLGNVIVKPRGPVEITNMFGKKVATLKMNESAGAVLPKEVRKFETLWQDNGLAFGKYEAVMSLGYGEDGRKTISAALGFWVLPGKLIGFTLGGIAFLFLLIFVAVKLYVKRKLGHLPQPTSPTVRPMSTSAVVVLCFFFLLLAAVILWGFLAV